MMSSSSAFCRGFLKCGGGACGVCRRRALIRGVAPPTSSHREFETKIESVWWSKKEKEKERGK